MIEALIHGNMISSLLDGNMLSTATLIVILKSGLIMMNFVAAGEGS
ncbi:MAG: hypothetical protein WDO70_01500 [Alphaproteobacteria bacterium]